MTWKYLDNYSVYRVNVDGTVDSTLASKLPGITPQPADPQPKPTTVEMSQARLALLQAGLLDAVNTAVLGMSQQAQIEWNYRAKVVKTNPFVQEMKTLLSWSDDDLDDLFELASTL